MSSNGEDDIKALIRHLESDIGVPDGFFRALLKEDDWSFVIKLHALFESAVTHLLEHTLGVPKLGSILGNLELSDKHRGKLAFARELDVLDSSERRFLSVLSEIRNDLVHDVRNVSFDFESYISSRDSNQRKQFARVFESFFSDYFTIGGTEVRREDFILGNPKFALWQASMFILAIIYQQKELARLQSEFNRLSSENYELLKTSTKASG